MAHALKDRGYQISIVRFGGEDLVEDDAGVMVRSFQRSPLRGLGWWQTRRNFLKFLKESEGFDLIEIPEHEGFLPFHFSKFPVVVRLHLSFSFWWQQLGRSWLYRPNLQWSERQTLNHHKNWIGCSGFILKKTKEHFGIKPTLEKIIYNPVKPVVEQSLPELRQRIINTGEYVLYAGMLSVRKGALKLAEAANIFFTKHNRIKLVFAGPQEKINGHQMHDQIMACIRPEFRNRLIFLGQIPHTEVFCWLACAKVFVSPSQLEAFSIVVMEAMQAGTPVVYSTKHSGPEAIQHGYDGLLANPDSKEDIAANVLKILDCPSFAEKVAQNARTTVEKRFSVERCVDETLGFYNQAIEDWQQRRNK
jgi:glycosyltransferase involved in cell wall biosynthesis